MSNVAALLHKPKTGPYHDVKFEDNTDSGCWFKIGDLGDHKPYLKGWKVRVSLDDYPENPLKNDEPVWHLACWHRRSELGTEQVSDPISFLERLLCEAGYGLDPSDTWGGYTDSNLAEYTSKTLQERHGSYGNYLTHLVLQYYLLALLGLHEHSSMTMWVGGAYDGPPGTQCEWDSGQVGIAYILRSDAVKQWGNKVLTKKVEADARQFLKWTVEEYDYYLRGEVYDVEVLRPDGDTYETSGWNYGEGSLNDALISILPSEKQADALLSTCGRMCSACLSSTWNTAKQEIEDPPFRMHAILCDGCIRKMDKGVALEIPGFRVATEPSLLQLEMVI